MVPSSSTDSGLINASVEHRLYGDKVYRPQGES